MNWSLMVSDLAGRTIGLIGLMATAVALRVASAHWTIDSDGFTVSALVFLFMFVMTAVFLIPGMYDRVLKRCMSFGPRLKFTVTSATWLILCLVAISQGFKPPRGLFAQYFPVELVPYLMATLGFLYVVFIFPFGLTFYSARRFFIETGDYIQPEKAVETPKEKLRKRDIWDHLVELPFYIFLVFPSFAVFFGNAAPTAEWNDWVNSNFWTALVAVGAITLLPAVLRTHFRAPHNKQVQQITAKRTMILIIGGPIVSFLALWVLLHHGVPVAWNYLTQNPIETIEYEVVDVSTGRRTRGCIDFKPVQAPDLEVSSCNLDSYWASRLTPGDIVRISGELSWFGHSFDYIELENN